MVKCFKTLVHGVVLKTVVIYCDTMVLYCGMLTLENEGTAVNYLGIFISLVPVVFKQKKGIVCFEFFYVKNDATTLTQITFALCCISSTYRFAKHL